jgi:predicted dehydrogenase
MFDSSSFDRRGFLKGAAATLTALMSERGLSAASSHTQDDDEFTGEPVKVAVIGLGPWGREILTNLARLNSVTVTGISDNYPAFLKRSVELAPKAKTEADYRALLSSADVEAVIVATPSHLHKEVVLAALQAGKHVYCEAPLASTIDDARAIAMAGRGAGKLVFASGLQGRSNALQRHVWNFVKSGVLGDAAIVRAQWSRKDSWRRAAPTPERERDVNWRLDKATSAGLPGEVAIHQFDLISSYLESLPTAVSASGATIAWRDGREVPDTVECVLEYPRSVRALYSATLASSFGGAYNVFQGSNSSLLVREHRAWLFKEADSPLLGWEVYARKETVHDETGIALVADSTKILAEGKEPGQDGPAEPEQGPLYLALDNFARSVRGQAQVNAGPDDGYRATVVAIKAHEAALAGSRIEFKPDWFTLT